MNEKMSDRLLGALLVALAIVLAFVARPAPAQEESPGAVAVERIEIVVR